MSMIMMMSPVVNFGQTFKYMVRVRDKGNVRTRVRVHAGLPGTPNVSPKTPTLRYQHQKHRNRIYSRI